MVKQTVRCVWHDSVGSMLPGCTEREKYLVSVSPAPADGTAPAARLSNKGARPSSPEAGKKNFFTQIKWQSWYFVARHWPAFFVPLKKTFFFASQPPSRTWLVRWNSASHLCSDGEKKVLFVAHAADTTVLKSRSRSAFANPTDNGLGIDEKVRKKI